MPHALFALVAGRSGHFRMESGLHSTQWFELNALFHQPDALAPHVRELARQLRDVRPDFVCGPATGGARLAALLAAELGCRSITAGRHENPAATGLFPTRYRIPAADRDALRGQRVALVDDAISAGSAIRGSDADLRECGAEVVAYGALIVFGDSAARLADAAGIPLRWVTQVPYSLWPPGECPLCAAGVPLERVSEAS